jgi:hypothetical protein
VNWSLAFGAEAANAGETVIELTSGRIEEPFPRSGTMTGRCNESVINVRLPVVDPVVVAANFTLKLLLCPPARVRGIVNPVMLNPVPERTAWLTFTGVLPVLITVTGSALLVPTFADTVRLSGATAMEGSGSANPAQPETQAIVKIREVRSTRTDLPFRKFISI